MRLMVKLRFSARINWNASRSYPTLPERRRATLLLRTPDPSLTRDFSRRSRPSAAHSDSDNAPSPAYCRYHIDSTTVAEAAAARITSRLAKVVPAIEIDVGTPHGRESRGAVRQLTEGEAVAVMMSTCGPPPMSRSS
jgi:hypothetical protein